MADRHKTSSECTAERLTATPTVICAMIILICATISVNKCMCVRLCASVCWDRVKLASLLTYLPLALLLILLFSFVCIPWFILIFSWILFPLIFIYLFNIRTIYGLFICSIFFSFLFWRLCYRNSLLYLFSFSVEPFHRFDSSPSLFWRCLRFVDTMIFCFIVGFYFRLAFHWPVEHEISLLDLLCFSASGLTRLYANANIHTPHHI